MTEVVYREVPNSRHYQYRYIEDGIFTGWFDAGPAIPETLAEIAAGFNGAADGYQVRKICKLIDDADQYVGELIFGGFAAGQITLAPPPRVFSLTEMRIDSTRQEPK